MAEFHPDADIEDISAFLKAEGIDLGDVQAEATEEDGVPIIPAAEVYNFLEGNHPPEDLQPLPLNPAFRKRLSQPIFPRRMRNAADRQAAKKQIHELSNTLGQELIRLVEMAQSGELDLNLDRVAAEDARLGAIEAVTNSFYHGLGLRTLQLARTVNNNLYVGVSNLALDFPDAPVYVPRPPEKDLRIGNYRPHNPDADRGARNQSGRGLYLIGRLSVNALREGSEPSAGLYSSEIVRIPEVVDGEPTGQTYPISRLVTWAVYGAYPPEPDQRADVPPAEPPLAAAA